MTIKRPRYDNGEVLSRMGKNLIDGDFKCKTCNQRFPTFQALGGHRTSHKRPKVMAAARSVSGVKPQTHECSICGLEFGTGQTLGGHMRRHQAGGAAAMGSISVASHSVVNAEPGLEKASSSKRVLCFDLNLMPYENNLN